MLGSVLGTGIQLWTNPGPGPMYLTFGDWNQRGTLKVTDFWDPFPEILISLVGGPGMGTF